MDRRPPPFRSSDASPRRNHNRPWSGGNDDGQSGRSSYATVRSNSPGPSPGRAGRDYYEHYTPSAASPRASSSASYNGVDTTTTIDGSKGSLAGGLSSYERYRSLQSSRGATSSVANTKAETSSSLDIHARAASLLGSSVRNPIPADSTSSPRRMSSSSPRESPHRMRSSSPRDLRKQRLQQQYSSQSTAGRTSPYRSQQQAQTQQPLAPRTTIPRSNSSSSRQGNSEEWLDRIRKANATEEPKSTQTKEKKLKKSSRKSSKKTADGTELAEDEPPDRSLRSSRKAASGLESSSHSRDDPLKRSKKSKKKSSKSKRSPKRSSASGDEGGLESCDDEVMIPSRTAQLPGSSLREAPAIEVALTKLGRSSSSPVPSSRTTLTTSTPALLQSADGGYLARARARRNSLNAKQQSNTEQPLEQLQTTLDTSSVGRKQRVVPESGSPDPIDEKPSTSNSAVRGWSTFRQRNHSQSSVQSGSSAFASQSSGDSAKVSEYLTFRKSFASGATPSIGKGNAGEPSSLYAGPSQPENTAMFAGSFSNEGTSEEEEDDASASSSEEEEEYPSDQPEWSVRVCVISAIDLPANVVPTAPFSPVLKVGLVRFKSKDAEQTDEEDLVEPPAVIGKAVRNDPMALMQAELKRSIHVSGLAGIPKARVRSTSSKVISKRDNGSLEFHEEMRWDANQSPDEMALAVELSARAVMTPSNQKESPYEQSVKALDFPTASRLAREASGGPGDRGRIGSMFRRGVAKSPSSEMEVANAAAAVAQQLVKGEEEGKTGDEEKDGSGPSFDVRGSSTRSSMSIQSSAEIDAKLLEKPRKRKPRMTEDIRLGSQVIPISKLSWTKAMKSNEATRIEQWFELETAAGGSSMSRSQAKTARNPSILLEISFSAPVVLDDSEDDLEDGAEDGSSKERRKNASFSRRASMSIRSQLRKEVQLSEVKQKEEEPVLEPGVIDYVCVVGARNIGDQKSDDGASGWVNSAPETCVLEQFPPSPDYHVGNGRNVALPDKVEWFCFPEGCRLWRGTTPPNADELNLVRFSASSPANIATTIASFDACLGCTSSFSWFILASNSDEYGSASQKTFGACIRFFVPAPTGIDPTQDDFGQSIRGAALNDKASKRLWVPMAICMTSQIPIVGTMEVMLLRTCEALSAMVGSDGQLDRLGRFFEDVASLVINYQRPIPGVVSSSIPFLGGDPLTLTLPPSNGLPPLPHGASITSVCRLLGANGINFLLAAMLTECKILLHSDDIGNLCLVAEVMTALMYPFQWALPYIPVLPVPMMEFIEAPLSYLLGVPSTSVKLISEIPEDVVMIDLDNDFSSAGGIVDELGRNSSANPNTKVPTPLPASTASNISKAVYRLLQHNDNNDQGRNGSFASARSFPRMARETQVEREFRIAVALEVAGLVRGFQDHLVIGPSNQPMFNVEKFLQTAPILFDEQRGTSLTSTSGLRVLSPRSRRFVSILVTCQHFHQFLEVSESESLSFFRQVMNELEAFGSKRDVVAVKRVLSLDAQKTIDQLSSTLKRLEDKVSSYMVKRSGCAPNFLSEDDLGAASSDFPYSLLCPISLGSSQQQTSERAEGVNQISLEYLVELEKNPWRYQSLFGIELGESKATGFVPVSDKVKLRDAIGERQYLIWKNAVERGEEEHVGMLANETQGPQTLDWMALLSDSNEEPAAAQSSSKESDPADAAKKRVADAKDRDLLRRCLEQARVAGNHSVETSADPSRDLVAEAEKALQNQSARRFLLAILSKRGSSETSDSRSTRRSNASKLDSGAFEVLLRLGCAMLDACLEDRDYDTSYALLKLTAGLFSTVEGSDPPVMLYMTQRLGHHPIFADLGVWLTAKKMHFRAASEGDQTAEAPDSNGESVETDEYEAAVATLYEMLGYGIPAEELARFASRVSEENGWFGSERGQSLLLLARRICMRRDTGPTGSSQKTTSDIEMMSPTATQQRKAPDTNEANTRNDDRARTKSHQPMAGIAESWSEIGWIHPSAQYSSRFEKDVKRKSPQSGKEYSRHMKRSAVTSMAYLGSSVVATGSLDGGVFLARNALSTDGEEGGHGGVRGIHLDWGSSGSRFAAPSSANATDGAYGVGAVTTLAGTMPANHSYEALQMRPGPSTKCVSGPLDEEELLSAMDGCRVVAGTTCGDLRVWSVKDVLSAVFFANRGNDIGSIGNASEDRFTHRSGEGASSSFVGTGKRSSVDFAAGSSLTRLKFSLRGRALSGHRGGVSCIDVPSHVYRPDSIISGGADGLIKLWSLRTGAGRRGEPDPTPRNSATSTSAEDQISPRTKASRSGDAMSILSGHGGRVLCVKTAWHGDRLLSGGADRTVRLWDLAGSGGKCLNSLCGHFGWVTSVKYWGPNTIISASTDRSIALWDARVSNAPLFTLRHHYAPISDILVGSRTDPIMISAGGDGTIAAWDFRRLSDPACQSPSSQNRQCKVIRRPAGKMYLQEFTSRRRTYGPVLLSRGPSSKTKTVCCLGRDSIIREWDIKSGEVVSEVVTGHCDTISSFAVLDGDQLHDAQLENTDKQSITGTITTSWDGTVRMRRLEQK